MRLSVVIVNWNSGEYLRSCLASIRGAELPDGWGLSVVVVDNASTDDSLSDVDATIIRNDANRGFGAACNQGAAAIESEAILFLNPDARLFSDSLRVPLSLIGLAGKDRIGIIGIRLVDESGNTHRHCARFPKPRHYLAKALGLDRVFPSTGHFMTEWDHLGTRAVDHVLGAFFLVRRNVFDALKGFDERFFVYLEDLDFSLRAAQGGWITVYLGHVSAFHAAGGSSRQILGRRLFYSLRSRLQYGRKHFSALGFLMLVVTSLVVEPITRFLLAALRRRRPELRALGEGYGLLWREMIHRAD